MIMPLRRSAPDRLAVKVCQVSDRPHQAMSSAPSTPKAEASLAVATPVTMDRKTKAMSSTTGMSALVARTRSQKLRSSGSGGMRSGWRSDQRMMYPENNTSTSNAGRMPAMNMRMTDTSDATA